MISLQKLRKVILFQMKGHKYLAITELETFSLGGHLLLVLVLVFHILYISIKCTVIIYTSARTTYVYLTVHSIFQLAF